MTTELAARRIAIRWLPLAALKPDPDNARLHSERQIARIADSIAAFGFNVPLLADERLNLIAGHGRLAAAKRLGLEKAPTVVLRHLSEAGRRAFRIADNRLGEMSSWDEGKLRLEFAALKDLDLDFALEATGFEADEIDLRVGASVAAVAERGGAGAGAVNDHASGPPVAAVAERGGAGAVNDRAYRASVARPGDAWRIGPHRLACGEERNPSDLFAVDAAIRRWQALTRRAARLEATGDTFAALSRTRRASLAPRPSPDGALTPDPSPGGALTPDPSPDGRGGSSQGAVR